MIFVDGGGWVRGRNGGTCEGILVRNPGPKSVVNARGLTTP